MGAGGAGSCSWTISAGQAIGTGFARVTSTSCSTCTDGNAVFTLQ
jgi:hypothetical protein